MTRCPTCNAPLRNLLSGCRKPECLRADLDCDRRTVDHPSKED